ncbi:18642_t:CDS:2 [Funneliformis geosporum]|uniref:18642_t:CDS:1 n=1 Tax=Funneliformis geosporum TaxID=1117311 RepID=A0A9W4SU06_9GLOM|nr:18642_t:CDS:2 [Funneliformis geosporum]
MKNFTDLMQLSCQNLILKRLESQEHVYEITLEVISEVSSIFLSATEIPKKNGQKKKVKIDEKPVTEPTINYGEKLKGLTAHITSLI